LRDAGPAASAGWANLRCLMEKIGRNDLCPCGSGKKFKKCHMGREDALFGEGGGEFPLEMSERITALPEVEYGRSLEMKRGLDLRQLTGSEVGVRFIDLEAYRRLDRPGNEQRREMGDAAAGGIFVNVLKTRKSDPHHVYVAISSTVEDGTLVHQLAHVLDYLAGSRLMPGLSKPLSFDLGIPVEHLEHPREFGHWLAFLQEKFHVEPDADDAIIGYLYGRGLLIEGEHIRNQDAVILKTKSERILKFMSENSAEIDAVICERKGYIGSRTRKDH
jgi:hypothetical protein